MTTIVAYAYRADLHTPDAVVEELIGEGRLAPAARGMKVEDALWQLSESEGLLPLECEDTEVMPYPVFLADLPGLGDVTVHVGAGLYEDLGDTV